MKIRGVLALVSVPVLFLSACSSAEKSDNAIPSPSPTSIVGCYAAAVGDDRAFLRIDEADGAVNGVLEYAFAQKDSSWGLIKGTLSDTAMTVEYQYASEGVVSTRTLTLTRSGNGFAGEGFTYQPTESCGRGQGWSEATVSGVVADTFHDPETGYYARTRFLIDGPTNGYRYRCISTVNDASGTEIAQWIAFGITDKTTGAKRQGMQTNIRPEQVEEVKTASVTCEVMPMN